MLSIPILHTPVRNAHAVEIHVAFMRCLPIDKKLYSHLNCLCLSRIFAFDLCKFVIFLIQFVTGTYKFVYQLWKEMIRSFHIIVLYHVIVHRKVLNTLNCLWLASCEVKRKQHVFHNQANVGEICLP